jgi:quercetin dioxygenase-like cupin family protein
MAAQAPEVGSHAGPLEFFDATGLVEETPVMSAPEYRPEFSREDNLDALKALGQVASMKLLFRTFDPATPMTLVHFSLEPGCILPAHTHNADCLYYVTRGSLSLGARVVSAGEGFFVPAGRAYTYVAGDEGTELVEFRASTDFDIKITEVSKGRWDLIRDRAEAALAAR